MHEVHEADGRAELDGTGLESPAERDGEERSRERASERTARIDRKPHAVGAPPSVRVMETAKTKPETERGAVRTTDPWVDQVRIVGARAVRKDHAVEPDGSEQPRHEWNESGGREPRAPAEGGVLWLGERNGGARVDSDEDG